MQIDDTTKDSEWHDVSRDGVCLALPFARRILANVVLPKPDVSPHRCPVPRPVTNCSP